MRLRATPCHAPFGAPPPVPPTGPEVRTRTGKMEAAAEPLRSVRLLSRVLLFLSQCYVLSGDGEFKVGDRSGQPGGSRSAEGRRQTTGRHSPPGRGNPKPKSSRSFPFHEPLCALRSPYLLST